MKVLLKEKLHEKIHLHSTLLQRVVAAAISILLILVLPLGSLAQNNVRVRGKVTQGY
jgi:hypothetical protein